MEPLLMSIEGHKDSLQKGIKHFRNALSEVREVMLGTRGAGESRLFAEVDVSASHMSESLTFT